jgi:UDP-N-acetylmuramoylalanine--D-glutamate ligase
VAEAASADLTSCAAVLRRATTLRHRIELVEDVAGVAYYDDSKATTPSAVLAALAGFERVLLIAGGRNKGLRLGSIAETLEAESSEGGGPGLNRLAAVVAIGESADEVVGVFAGKIQGPVLRAASMAEAVGIASRLARPGDSVILSPGCASFDWYRNYGERGDDFARLVRRLAGEAGGSSGNGKGQEAAAWLGGAGRER